MKGNFYIDINGKIEEISLGSGKSRPVRFPVCLAVKHKENIAEVCSDFVLNPTKKKLFIKTRAPLPKGSRVLLNFYIPPESKLLGKFQGKVVETYKDESSSQSMQIEFAQSSREQMLLFQDFLNEKRHLVDLST